MSTVRSTAARISAGAVARTSRFVLRTASATLRMSATRPPRADSDTSGRAASAFAVTAAQKASEGWRCARVGAGVSVSATDPPPHPATSTTASAAAAERHARPNVILPVDQGRASLRQPAVPTVGCMPILTVHLVDGLHTPAQHAELLTAMSARYAEVLGSPVDRVRAYVTLLRPEHWATGGVPGGAVSAPYFTAIVLEGRPAEQRRRLLADLTDLLVDVLGVDRSLVRGRIIQVHPDDWGIGGVPAGELRAAEIAARAAAAE